MKIAILGWGSLVWQPLSLKDQLEDDGDFKRGGPKLPLEFSRISEDGRLTLVIDEQHGVPAPTRYAISKQSDLAEAVTDLWIRETHSDKGRSVAKEESKDGSIGYADLSGHDASINDHPDHKIAYERILEWLQHSQELDVQAVVWTALTSNYRKIRLRDFSVEDAVDYLDKLPEESRKRAFEYIQEAPEEVETPLRTRVRDRVAAESAAGPGNRPKTFTPAETQDLTTELEKELRGATQWASINFAWDLIFKVALLILGIVSATDAGLIAKIWKNGSPPRWAIILNIVAGVLITALAGFANAQVNFSARTEIYRKKETALRILIDALKYLNPERVAFLKLMQEIYSWNDSTPTTVQLPDTVFSRPDDSGK
jgi:hypothetical protein